MKTQNSHKPLLPYLLFTHSNKRGTTIVEFALILPIFFVIIFGIIEFGIMMYDKAMIINASREAARAAVVYGSNFTTDEDGDYNFFYMSNENIENTVISYCNKNLISFKSGSEIKIETDPPDPENGSSGEYLSVKVEYDFDFLVFSKLSKIIIDSPVILRAETMMRFE